MVGSHVAHDCEVGNHVVFANNATLGGHVHMGDYVFMGGLSAPFTSTPASVARPSSGASRR